MIACLIVVATLFSYAFSWAIGIPALVPVLNTAASYPFMVQALKRGDLAVQDFDDGSLGADGHVGP